MSFMETMFGTDPAKQREQQEALRQMLEGIRNTGGSLMDNGNADLMSRLLPFLNNIGAEGEAGRNLFGGASRDVMNNTNPYNAEKFFGQDPFGKGINGQMQGGLDKMGGYGDSQAGLGGLAGQVFSGGGWSKAGQNVFDNLDQFRAGGNQRMGNMAEQIINSGGANPFSNFTVDKGTESLNRGGKTSQSGALENFGQQGLQSRGMTPWDQMALGSAQDGLRTQGFNGNSNALSQAGQGLLASHGRDASNQFMTNRGEGILGKDPLLSMDAVTGMAADKAGSLFSHNAEQNYRQAMNRGGGPAVRSGLQNQAVQENENEALRAVGDASTNARMQQQGLQMNHFGQGKDLMSSGMSDRMNQEQLGGQLTGQGEQSALQRMLGLTGLGNSSSDRALNAQQIYSQMMGQSGNLENQNMSTLGGLGMQGLGAANQKLGMGINLQGQTSNADLQALQQYMSNLTGMNNYALGAGNLSNGAFAGAGNTVNSQFGNNLQGGAFGQSRMNDQYKGQMGNIDRGLNNTYQNQGLFQSGLNPLQNTFNVGADMFKAAGLGQTGLVQQGGSPGLLGTIIGAAGNAVKIGAGS